MPPIHPHHDTMTMARYLSAKQVELLDNLAGGGGDTGRSQPTEAESTYLVEWAGRGWVVEIFNGNSTSSRRTTNSTVIGIIRCGLVKVVDPPTGRDVNGDGVWYAVSEKGRAVLAQRKRLPNGLIAK